MFVCICVNVQGHFVYLRLACTLFEFTFTNGRTHGHAVVYCPEFSGVCLSNCNFEMTGLLSVFSLLPVQTLKKREDSQEEVEEDPGGLRVKQAGGGKLSSQEDGESSDKDTER